MKNYTSQGFHTSLNPSQADAGSLKPELKLSGLISEPCTQRIIGDYVIKAAMEMAQEYDASLKAVRWFGIVRWHPQDVVGVAETKGIQMTEEEAAKWWEMHEKEFKNRMVELGNEVLYDMIDEGNGKNE